MPMPLCHILRARLRQQGKGDKSILPVRDNSTSRLQLLRHLTGFMELLRMFLEARAQSEIVNMIRKGQFRPELRPFQHFCQLAA